MSVREKYEAVLELGKALEIENGSVTEENGVLKIGGLAKTPFEKDLLWDTIKKAGGENPTDVQVDIKVKNAEFYHVHKVAPGDSLGAISQRYLGNGSRYNEIFEVNRDQLDDPNHIQVGQELKIPFKS